MELVVLLQNYGIMRTKPFSKNANPIFAQRKSSEKLGLLVDLGKLNAVRRLHQKQPSGQYINWRSNAYGGEKIVLQT